MKDEKDMKSRTPCRRTLTGGPKYVNGKVRVAMEVETLPSASVMRVEDKVSQDGSGWDG